MVTRLSEGGLLLALPVDVICEGILLHLSVRDLQTLDTALTNKELRPQLKEVWKSFQWSRLDVRSTCDELAFLNRLGVQILEVKTNFLDHSEMFTSLLKLELFDNNLFLRHNDEWLCRLGHICRKLNVLRLPRGDYSDIGVTALAQHCHQLHTISLISNNITDAGIQALCDYCPYLLHIGISSCHKLTDASLMAIASTYSRLQCLHIFGCLFSEDAVLFVSYKCRELQSVMIHCYKTKNRGLTALWAANPKLTEANISWRSLVSDNDIKLLSQCCIQLQQLTLSHCRNITDAAVIAVAERCPHLRSLNVSSCANISDASLIAVGQHCHELKSLEVSSCWNITDDGIAALTAGCPLLEICNAGCTHISDSGAIALANGCSGLRKVNVKHCNSISIVTIMAFIDKCPLLSELDVCGTSINDACLYAIAQNCHNLTVLDIRMTNITESAVKVVVSSCRLMRTLLVQHSVLCDETRTYFQRRYPDVLVG